MIPDIRKGRFCKSACAEQIWPKTSICFPYAQCNSAFLLESQFIQHCYIVVVLHPPITYMYVHTGPQGSWPLQIALGGRIGDGYGEDGKDFWRTAAAGKGERLGLEESTREQMPTIWGQNVPSVHKCSFSWPRNIMDGIFLLPVVWCAGTFSYLTSSFSYRV